MIIQTVANVVKNDSQVRVTVVGKTDRRRSAAANAALSQKRADRVRDALIAQAVPANRMTPAGLAKASRTWATADNIAEQAQSCRRYRRSAYLLSLAAPFKRMRGLAASSFFADRSDDKPSTGRRVIAPASGPPTEQRRGSSS